MDDHVDAALYLFVGFIYLVVVLATIALAWRFFDEPNAFDGFFFLIAFAISVAGGIAVSKSKNMQKAIELVLFGA